MSILSKLFGNKDTSFYEAEEYNGFRITPQPISENGTFRISARIEKEIDGELKVHEMIRADTISSEDDASASSIAKAKMFIDQMGDEIFR